MVLTHFQTLSAADLESSDALLRALAGILAEQLDLEMHPSDLWDLRRSPTLNFRRYLRREVLEKLSTPVVWGLDEVDRLFTRDYGSEVFGLFRSWHDERALEPGGPWTNLTLAMAYSTEAHLFITDVNQSPFNVGTRLTLEDFTRDQVADLNGRYGGPIRGERDLDRFYDLLGGHPFLVRRGLHELASRGASLVAFEVKATAEDWIFGEHLRRISLLLSRDAELSAATREVLQGRPCPSTEAFYRLRSAGVLGEGSPSAARTRCRLYSAYLAQALA